MCWRSVEFLTFCFKTLLLCCWQGWHSSLVLSLIGVKRSSQSPHSTASRTTSPYSKPPHKRHQKQNTRRNFLSLSYMKIFIIYRLQTEVSYAFVSLSLTPKIFPFFSSFPLLHGKKPTIAEISQPFSLRVSSPLLLFLVASTSAGVSRSFVGHTLWIL